MNKPAPAKGNYSSKVPLFRFSTAGSVDDGKSTLIGRLLYETGNVCADHIEALELQGAENNAVKSLALVTDGLEAEREQGITIDVAYRYFSTARRNFVLADAPGHEQYTRNMATAASSANLTLILVDASKGLLPQTKRHAFIADLLGVPRLLICINKMDLVEYDQYIFNRLSDEFSAFAKKLNVRELRFIPISALEGDNVVQRSPTMKWYHGETVLEHLESVYFGSDRNQVDFRFPVQYVITNKDYRGYAGQIFSGSIRKGETIVALPSLQETKVKSIHIGEKEVQEALAPMSVAIALESERDISRGDLIARSKNRPRSSSTFEAMLIWMSSEPLELNSRYIIRHTTSEARAFVDRLDYRIEVENLHRQDADTLSLNEIGRVHLTSTKALFLDSYRKNRQTGGFVLVDPESFQTVAAGMVIDRLPEDNLLSGKEKPAKTFEEEKNIRRELSHITREDREKALGGKAITYWLTGLSGSGKSTIAKELELLLYKNKRAVYLLDGDNLRTGLNRDLGFAKKERAENIRRAAETAQLFNEAGVSVICSFISPYAADRELARDVIGKNCFFEVHVATALEVCEERDPKGLYKKARSGEIPNFTGVSAPYEKPKSPKLVLDTAKDSLEECLEKILKLS